MPTLTLCVNTALYVGRFQPFHIGHYKSILAILEEMDEIVVAIGTADSSHTGRNPFEAGERIRMITNSLEDCDQTVYTVPIVDIDRNALWVQHVESLSPHFDVVYTNNELVSCLFRESGYQVRNHTLFNRETYAGEEVRKRMMNDDDWQTLVPDDTAEEIERIGGVNRIKQISNR